MKFDFKINSFVDLDEHLGEPLIVGTDQMLTQKQVYDLHCLFVKQITELGIPEGHPVCIYGEKEAVFPVIMITLISLNIPYIPIDLIMPYGRIAKIKEQSGSRVLINCSGKDCGVDFEMIISGKGDIIKHSSVKDFALLRNDDPVRYILFTSGSTGAPKGVQVTASALNSFVEWFLTWPLIDKSSVFMNQAPFSFDVSLCDVIGSFANGSMVILNNYAILKSAALFLSRLSLYKVNTLICTPSFLQMYLSVPEFNAVTYPQLRQIIFMGEELQSTNVRKLKSSFPLVKIVNAYGPTEATVVTTYIEISDEIMSKYANSLPIGYCRPHGEIEILSRDIETGLGEIAISGPHLSIGYLNDDEKTKNSFVSYDKRIIYKTGDLGYKIGSLIFYSGRNDSQIKLNGYRIELDEITNVLLSHPNISNASVIGLTKGKITKKLIAFIVPAEKGMFSDGAGDLQEFLLKVLPTYMIPSEFIMQKDLPLNSNFKTDKKALMELYLYLQG